MNLEIVEPRYQPGACNIGPEEIARRRRSGHVGTAATVALASLLVATRAPRMVRLLTAIPATAAAAGYVQARLRFCAGYGHLGLFNFGAAGSPERVADSRAAAADRRRARQISIAAGALGLLVGIGVALLPTRR